MSHYQILYWYDIPVQVRVRHKRERISKSLPGRFQEAIDNAAMHAGLTGDDAYLDGFRWSEPQERAGTPQEVATTVASELEAQYPEIDWQRTATDLKSKIGDALSPPLHPPQWGGKRGGSGVQGTGN